MPSSSKKTTITPRLVVIEGNDKGKVISLRNGTSVIGRSKADIIIADPRISRSHVALHFDSKEQILSASDLKSLNGTLLNGDPLTEGKIQDGDRLQIGDTILDIHLSPSDETLASFQGVGERSLSIRKEPHPPKQQPQEKKPEPLLEGLSSTHPSFLSQFYQRIPTPVRVLGLVLLFGIVYLGSLTGTNSKPTESLERQISSVRQLEITGKIDEAVIAAETIAKNNPDDSRAFLLLGDVYSQQQRTEGAIASYQKAHSLSPTLPVLHVRLAQQFLRSGFFNEGREEIRHLDSTLTGAKDSDDTRLVFTGMAQLYLEFRDELKLPSERILIISKALQTTMAPDNSLGYRLESEIHFQESRFAEAQEPLLKAMKLWPKDEEVLDKLIRARIYAEDVKGAEEVIQSWVQLNPDATRPLIVSAVIKNSQKNYEAALLSLQKVVGLLAKTPQDPHYGQALHSMGLIYQEQNKISDARESFRQACDVGVETSCKQPILQTDLPGTPPPRSPSHHSGTDPAKPVAPETAVQALPQSSSESLNPMPKTKPTEAPTAGKAVPQ